MAHSLSPEVAFLLNRAKAAISLLCTNEQPDPLPALLFDRINVAQTLRLARQHGLSGLIEQTLHSETQQLSNSNKYRWFRDAVQRDLRNFADRTRIFSAETIRAVECLRKAKIRALVFKGVALQAELYGTAGLRTFSDIDLYVEPAKVEYALDALSADGWIPAIQASKRQLRYLLQAESQMSFVSKYSGVELELHWGLRYEARMSPGIWPAGLKKRHSVEIADRKLSALAPEDQLTALILHGQKYNWSSLKWLCDLALFHHRFPEVHQKKVVANLDSLGSLYAAEVASQLVEVAFGREYRPLKIASSERACSEASAILSRIESRPDLGWATVWRRIAHRRGLFAKCSLLLNSLFRPRQPDVLAVDLPILLSPLYIPLRILRLFGRFIVQPLTPVPQTEALSTAAGASR